MSDSTTETPVTESGPVTVEKVPETAAPASAATREPTPVPARHPATAAILRHFVHEHLPEDLAAVSGRFRLLAHEIADLLPDTPELTVALRKLLESKDAAVRAAVDARDVAQATRG